MTQEDKELVLIDLSGRLPHHVRVKVNDTQGIMDEIDIPNERIFVSSLNPFLYGGAKVSWFTVNGDKIYPYLRPMSSMTEKEKYKLKCLFGGVPHDIYIYKPYTDISYNLFGEVVDWLNSHHFDYRGLIEKGLALEAPEGMYEIQN